MRRDHGADLALGRLRLRGQESRLGQGQAARTDREWLGTLKGKARAERRRRETRSIGCGFVAIRPSCVGLSQSLPAPAARSFPIPQTVFPNAHREQGRHARVIALDR